MNPLENHLDTSPVYDLDHLGIVVTLIRRFVIVDMIGLRLPINKKYGAKRIHGKRVMAMILMRLWYNAII